MSAAFRLIETEPAEGVRRFRAEIPAESPLFEGHFPGRPILPGIAHLALVVQALGTPLGGVRGLRLRRPVEPGDDLDLSLSGPGEDGWTRFEVRRRSETASSGTILGTRIMQLPAWDRAAFPATGGLPLLPHAPPARLVTGVDEASDQEIVCRAEIPRLHPLAAAGRAPAFLALEAAAQAAAALEALGRRESPGPRIGYLVGIREARLAIPFLPVEQPFRVAARLEGTAFPLSVYEVQAGEPGREIVQGTISTFLLEKP